MGTTDHELFLYSDQRWQNPFKAAFVLLFSFFYNFDFLRTTMLWSERYQDYQANLILLFDKLTVVLLWLAIAYVVFIYKRLSEKVCAIFLIILPLVYSDVRELSTVNTYLVFFLLIVCSKGISYKIVAWLSLLFGSFWILYSAIACKLGYISDIVFSGRHSFGSIYVTDLFCHFLTLFMVLCLLRKGKLKVGDYLLALIMLAMNVLYMQAKVGLACFLLLLAGTFTYQFICPKVQANLSRVKLFAFIAIVSFCFLTIVSLLISYFYSESPDVWYNKYSVFHTLEMRFRFGRQAFDHYSILPWGQHVAENGNGGRVDGKPVDNYFFLDISYVKVLFNNGWATLLILLTMFTALQVRLYKRREFYFLFVIAVFAVDCSVEHHIMQLSYSLFPYLLFATSSYEYNLALAPPVDIQSKEVSSVFARQ